MRFLGPALLSLLLFSAYSVAAPATAFADPAPATAAASDDELIAPVETLGPSHTSDTIGPPRPADATADDVQLHVTRGATLHGRADVFVLDPTAGQYSYLCSAPCDPVVPVATKLAVTIDDGEPATRIVKRSAGPDADLTVAPPSGTARKVGWALLGLGVGAAIGSGVFYASFAAIGEKPDAMISPKAIGLLGAIPIGLAAFGLLAAGTSLVLTSGNEPDVKLERRRSANAR